MVTSYGSISAGWVDLWHLSLESDKIIDVLGGVRWLSPVVAINDIRRDQAWKIVGNLSAR